MAALRLSIQSFAGPPRALLAALQQIENKLLNAKISIVISNIENAFILERAKNHNIKFAYISHKAKKREYFDREISFFFG